MSFCLKKLALSAGKVLPFSEFAATFLGVCSHLSPAYLITTPRTLNFQLSTFNFQLKKNGSFKHSHDNQPSSEHQ